MLKILKSDACEKPKTKKCSKALTKYAKKKYSKKEKKEKTTKSGTTAGGSSRLTSTGKGNIQQGTNNKMITNKISLPKDSIISSMGGSLSNPSYRYNSNFGTQLSSPYGTGSSWYAPQLNPTPQGGGSRYPTYHSPYGNNNYSVLSEGDKKTLKEYMDLMKDQATATAGQNKKKPKTSTGGTQTENPPNGFEFSGLGGFKRPTRGNTPKYLGSNMRWDKTNPKGNEKRTFDGREILKGWMPRYEEDENGQLTGKEFNSDTGEYEDPQARDSGSGESKSGDDEL